ncbi:MAG: type II toxin-antitoxin system Phd/YefM family antitoxin [Mycobacteriaceae bacterium]
MTVVPLSEAKDTLSALVEAAQSTHDIVTITRHGKPAAVLMSADDLESLQETVFWLSQPGVRDDISEADLALAQGAAISGSELRAELGLSE